MGVPVLFTVQQAAKLLGISPVSAYRMIGAGDLPRAPLSGKIRITRATLERILGPLTEADAQRAFDQTPTATNDAPDEDKAEANMATSDAQAHKS